MPDSQDAAQSLLRQYGLPADNLEPRHGWSNDVWQTPGHVVRLSSGRFRESFRHEARVLQLLQSRVNVPVLIAHGRSGEGEWMICKRAPGQNLLDAWPSMDNNERRSALVSLAHNLQQLHATAIGMDFENPWLADAVQIEGKAGDAYHVLPRFYPVIIDSLRKQALVDETLLARAESFLASRLALFHQEELVLVHDDIHFNNLLWDGKNVTLVDFEGAAAAPRDMELHTMLRFVHHPEQFYRQGEHIDVTPADLTEVLPVLREIYPSMFASPDLAERLSVYEVMWQLLQLHHFRPDHGFKPALALIDAMQDGVEI